MSVCARCLAPRNCQFQCQLTSLSMVKEPHIWTPAHDRAAAFPLMAKPQPDTAERTRLAVQAIPFAIPEKRNG